MPPKNLIDEEANVDLLELHPDSFYRHARSLSDISLGEILIKYQNDSQLLNHILLAKAQEDKRRTSEELRQAEEARLQTKFIEFELTQTRHDNHVNNSGSNSIFNPSFMDQQDAFSEHPTSLHTGVSPLPMTTSEFHYFPQQETASVSSSSPSIADFASNFDLYNSDMMISSSPPTFSEVLFSTPTPVNTPPPAVAKTKGKKKALSSTSSPPKHVHKTLSYESVMTLSGLNMNRKSLSPPPPPPQPLDHDKVMEALRAKLRKSSSPYPPTKPSPEPAPSPPNTYPKTGVLLLNLKSRRRKSSVTKTGNSAAPSK